MSEEQLTEGTTTPAVESEDLLTLTEAVEFLGTSKPTMYRWLERGEVKGLKVGKQWRFRKSDLVAYMERGPVALAAAPAEELEAEIGFFGGELERAGVAPVTLEDEAAVGEERIDLLARQMITLAVKAGSTDIHLEPVRHEGEAYLLLRIRIDGRLHEIRRMPLGLHEALVMYLKRASQMDLNERRLPQDGRRILVPFQEHELELRVASLPTLFGEGVVMRILARSISAVLGLDKLGLFPEDLERIHGLLQQPNGLILAAGPVGSGRTAFLYSGLQSIAGSERRSYVVDEYIEHRLPHVTPIRVEGRGGMTMPVALRALNWNDPDVVLVGSNADRETAPILQSMALTGHLVLAQGHAYNAAEALRRLVDLGIDPHSLSATVVGVVSMRLVRRICSFCKETRDTAWSDPMLEHWRILAGEGGYEVPDDASLYRGRGCEKCRNSGYKGRTGLYEILIVNEALSAAMARRASVEELAEVGVANGMRTLVADGVRKMVDGQTTLDEVRRVTTAAW
jgi:type IV pilus assembly protein PilB